MATGKLPVSGSNAAKPFNTLTFRKLRVSPIDFLEIGGEAALIASEQQYLIQGMRMRRFDTHRDGLDPVRRPRATGGDDD